ncbi:Holliday junction DNA helicase RuvA [Bacteroidales bacterium KA00251]|nr:Holliday junction DNA helicase RuvA [Bacteroidales bacterium KA00251]
MIAFIEGDIATLTPTQVVLNVGGLGYEVNITLLDYSQLHELKRAKLYVTEIIREDAYTLYGFLEESARLFFDKLRTVSGVGPATARLILSSFAPTELASIIDSGSVELLQTVKGIGLKSAQRIVVDLKGKLVLPEEPGGMADGSLTQASLEVAEEARRALTTLGFTDSSVRKILKKLLAKDPSLSVEELIRHSLKQL